MKVNGAIKFMAFLNLFLQFLCNLNRNKLLLKRLFWTITFSTLTSTVLAFIIMKNSYNLPQKTVVNQLWFLNRSDKLATAASERLTSKLNKNTFSQTFMKSKNKNSLNNFFDRKHIKQQKIKRFSSSNFSNEAVPNKFFNRNVFQKPIEDDRTVLQMEEVSWHLRKNKFDHLNENFIYNSFNVLRANKVEQVNLIIIVSSAPARIDRRLAIRQTWLKQCKSTFKLTVKCVFLTDWKPSSYGIDLQSESDKYGDIYFQNLTGGYDFGKRFLFHMVWAMQNFNFDYFLRLDDDYFLCLERFLNEIPMPPNKLYHWGWIHCIEDLVRPDESIVLLSKDLIEIFLGQDPETMLCHKWADQMIGIWINKINLPNFHYRHDIRLHHNPPASFVKYFKYENSICSKYIGIHGSYPDQMKTFWKNRGENNLNKNKTLNDYSAYCFYNQHMDWMLFHDEFLAKPILCLIDSGWDETFETDYYYGRQGA